MTEKLRRTHSSATLPLDNTQINDYIQRCKHLKNNFVGVFAANTFPKLSKNSFMIMNASAVNSIGTHWLLIANHANIIYFADPLGIALENYSIVYQRMLTIYNRVIQIFRLMPVQKENSNFCAFCIYIAHVLFLNYPYISKMNDNDLNRFAKHVMKNFSFFCKTRKLFVFEFLV